MNQYIKPKTKGYLKFKFHKWVLFSFFVVVSLPPLEHNHIIFLSLIILLAGALFLLIMTSKFRIKSYIIWVCMVDLVILLSGFWALNSSYAINGIKSFIVISIAFIYTSTLVKNEKDFYNVLKLFVYSKVIMAFYILLFVDLSTLGDTRIGAGSLGEDWNANDIGLQTAFSAFIVFVLIKNEKRNKVKLLYYFVLLLFGITTLLSGSRKALIVLVATIGLYSVLSSSKYKLGKVVIVSLIGGAVFYLIMNVPVLYDVIGSRIDSLLAVFTGHGVVDRSTILRMSMIEDGINFFKQRPITGYGINNFRELFGNKTGMILYAHNNYVELLVGIGVIGTVIYYLGYFFIIKNTFLKKDPLLVFAFVSIFIILIIEVGLVSYYQFYIQFLVCLSFSAIYIAKRKYKVQKRNVK